MQEISRGRHQESGQTHRRKVSQASQHSHRPIQKKVLNNRVLLAGNHEQSRQSFSCLHAELYKPSNRLTEGRQGLFMGFTCSRLLSVWLGWRRGQGSCLCSLTKKKSLKTLDLSDEEKYSHGRKLAHKPLRDLAFPSPSAAQGLFYGKFGLGRNFAIAPRPDKEIRLAENRLVTARLLLQRAA